jgi:hypothetical protein
MDYRYLMNLERPPLLIIAFKRAANVREIFRICKENGIRKIFVVVDGPRSERDGPEIEQVRQEVLNVTQDPFFEIEFRFRSQNVGCSASVLAACDWFFSMVDFGIILEDDCLPSPGFFDFVEYSRTVFVDNPRLSVACGSQLLEVEEEAQTWFLSQYPFHWGWATTSISWRKSLDYALNYSPPKFRSLVSLKPDESFWLSGARRAFWGYADVWDAIFANQIISQDLLVLLPRKNLILNNGNDAHATHTGANDVDTSRQIFDFKAPLSNPKPSSDFDKRIRDDYFKIGTRHIFSTKFTFFLDKLIRGRRKVESLPVRFEKSRLQSN